MNIFPLDSTLLESIYYPNKFTSLDDRLLFEKQVIKLLNEININSSQSTNVGIISLLNEKLD